MLAASLVFYGWWNPAYLPLLITSMLVNFLLSLYIRKTWIFRLAIILNLALLVWYKYAAFVLGIFTDGPIFHNVFENLILPLGISFFTFQQISYLVDTRRGRASQTDIWNYAAYIALFPQLIAGPIVRYHSIDKQLRRLRRGISGHTLKLFLSAGIALLALGLFKKIVIADVLSHWVDPVFSQASGRHVTQRDAWLGTMAYSFQIYFDFSAYSDMALGLGRMFGFILPVNFFSPYKAASIIEFWRRWHISLSLFVRDYIYIPLGGNRRGFLRQMIYLVIAFILIGVWHGAGYTFALWGVVHAGLVTGAHLWRRAGLPALPKFISWAATFFAVCMAWVLFRAANLPAAYSLYSDLFNPSAARIKPVFVIEGQFELGVALICFAAMIAFFAPNTSELLGSHRHTAIQGQKNFFLRNRHIRLLRRTLLPVLTGTALYFALSSIGSYASEFLYFNF